MSVKQFGETPETLRKVGSLADIRFTDEVNYLDFDAIEFDLRATDLGVN